MTNTSNHSPACDLLKQVFSNSFQSGTDWKCDRRLASLTSAAMLAVRYGMKWHANDFSTALNYNHSLTVGDCVNEAHYAVACGKERGISNPSFCVAYEKWKGRKPFVLKDEFKSGIRLYEGLQILWQGERWNLTAFADDGSYIRAVQHDYSRPNHHSTGLHVGGFLYVDREYRRIEALSEDGLTFTLSAEIYPHSVVTIARRIRITPEDLRAFNESRWPKAQEQTLAEVLP